MTRAEERAIDAWAIYEYREHPKGLYHTCFVDGYKEGYEQAEKDLGWISVKEKLPGPSEWVVACVEVDGICTCLALATYNEETKEWHTDSWEDGEQEVYNPDYWMPIPTKAKEDEK